MSTGADEIRNRITSLCCDTPFQFTVSVDPFSFTQQPATAIDAVCRIESEAAGVVGGFNYSEERTDLMRIWVARRQAADPDATYQRLQADARSLRAAVIRDGCTGGDYGVPNAGGSLRISKDRGAEFAVLQLTIPANYDAEL
jgi:hypothetical protein